MASNQNAPRRLPDGTYAIAVRLVDGQEVSVSGERLQHVKVAANELRTGAIVLAGSNADES